MQVASPLELELVTEAELMKALGAPKVIRPLPLLPSPSPSHANGQGQG